jgi:hypothetical protein
MRRHDVNRLSDHIRRGGARRMIKPGSRAPCALAQVRDAGADAIVPGAPREPERGAGEDFAPGALLLAEAATKN